MNSRIDLELGCDGKTGAMDLRELIEDSREKIMGTG